MDYKTKILRDVWCVLGLPFDEISLKDSVSFLNQSIKTKESCFLSTPNLNFLIATQSDEAFFQSVVDSHLSVADGMPLIWIAKLLNIPLPERVAGSTLFDELSKQKNKTEKIKVFFFGGQNGVAEQAHKKLNERQQALVSCGLYDPGFVSVDQMSTAKIVGYINSCSPDFIVVALGAKKGQAWIQKNRGQLHAPVVSHLGAVINFVAGHVIRAPVFWQRCGMEWLWRIRQEPALWQRYFFDGLAFAKLVVFKAVPLAVYDRLLRFFDDYKVPVSIDCGRDDKREIKLSGSIHFSVLDPVKQSFINVLRDGKVDVVLNFSDLVYIDGAFMGTLMLFQGCLNEQNRQLYLQNVPKRISRLLNLNHVSSRFQIKVS